MAIISAIVFTKKDQGGNNWVETWLLWEFTQAGYTPGGENINLTPYFQRVEMAIVQTISGALQQRARINAADFPGNPGSGRVQLFYAASGSIAISGLGISIASGTLLFVSGQLLSGNISGETRAVLHSGSIATAGFINAGLTDVEILSGVAVSGARAYIHALGY